MRSMLDSSSDGRLTMNLEERSSSVSSNNRAVILPLLFNIHDWWLQSGRPLWVVFCGNSRLSRRSAKKRERYFQRAHLLSLPP